MTGGKLNIEITNNNHVLMIGKAEKVYEGVMDIKNGEQRLFKKFAKSN